MNGFIVLIIIFILSQVFKGSKKVKTNRPGQPAKPAAAPGGAPSGERGVRRPYMPAQPVVKPTVQPIAEPAQAAFAPAAADAAAADGLLDESDRARTDLVEGESRECDHGSLGGSMDITTHMGQGAEYERAQVQVKPSRSDETADAPAALVSITKLTAAQMRQAVIVSEILKRPAERMQGRRWAAR